MRFARAASSAAFGPFIAEPDRAIAPTNFVHGRFAGRAERGCQFHFAHELRRPFRDREKIFIRVLTHPGKQGVEHARVDHGDPFCLGEIPRVPREATGGDVDTARDAGASRGIMEFAHSVHVHLVIRI